MSSYSPFQPWSSGSPYALALGIAATICAVIDPAVLAGNPAGDAEFLAKPFAPAGLLEAVRAALDARAATRLQMQLSGAE